MFIQWGLAAGLLLVALLYAFVSPKDTAEELRSVFDRRLLRRGIRFRRRLASYSIVDLFVLTTITGGVLGLVHHQVIPRSGAVPAGAAFIGLYLFLKYISYDLTMKGQRHQYPQTFRMIQQPPRSEGPKIQIASPDIEKSKSTGSP